MERELIRKELAMYGILVTDETSTVQSNGSEIKLKIEEQILKLKKSTFSHKMLTKQLWKELKNALQNIPVAITSGNEQTERMFIEAMKHLNRILIEMHLDRRMIKSILQRDINVFSEAFMKKIIDYKISIDWLHHIVMVDNYRISLLKAYLNSGKESKEVLAILGPWGGLDLPMQERVWEYNSDEESIKGHEEDKQHQQRYQLPGTYNSPYEFEEGFYYREIRNEPYAFGDDDNDPYPGRDLLWD